MIEVTRLTKRFGRFTAVDDVSLHLDAGKALALWGANGAGKTTIIKCLLGLLRYDGRITVAGRDARREGKVCRQSIGYVPQELALPADFRVVEALHFFAKLKRVPRAKLPETLAAVGLAGDSRKRVGELSGGMKQRLALGIALLADPPLLVLDELTSNLDREAQAAFLAMLVEQKQRGRTILFASHRAEEVELLADRVLGLRAGRRVFECEPAELAAAADLRCALKLIVKPEEVDRAVEVLRREKYAVGRNGRGVYVEVAATAKAGPLEALRRAGVELEDFELTALHTRTDGRADRG
jgi:ABC-type multidrug transport system ATPase subunit